MKNLITVIIFLFLLNVLVTVSAQEAVIDSTFHHELKVGLNYVAKSQFKEALELFHNLEREYPDHPAPNFFIAATYQSWMINYRISEFQDILYNNTELAIEKGEILLENDADPWLNFYIGAAYGFNALHLFRQHNWISSYFDAIEGIDNFEMALEKEPRLYDCYYGMGSYNYWRTAKSKFIRILVFWMEDKQDLGLRQLELSVNKGSYCSYEAAHGLIIAYYHNGDYVKALELNDSVMMDIDPPALSTLYMRGRLMATFARWDKVHEIFQAILERLNQHPYPSISYQVECKYWIAEALRKQNRPAIALEWAADALVKSKKWKRDMELENPFESFDMILEYLETLYHMLETDLAVKITQNGIEQ